MGWQMAPQDGRARTSQENVGANADMAQTSSHKPTRWACPVQRRDMLVTADWRMAMSCLALHISLRY
jgi:hypothetical protein